MYHKVPLFGSARLLLRICAVAAFLLFFASFDAKAQYYNSGHSDSDYSIWIGADYDAPVGNLSYTFKPGQNYNASFLWYHGDFSMNFSVGYLQYKVKQDTFYYQLSDTEYGKISYKNFSAYTFYIGLNYHLTLTDQVKAYTGINLGAYYAQVSYHSTDYIADAYIGGGGREQELYLAPKLGVNYMLTDNIGLGLEGKYNLFAPTGDARYNDRVGTLYNSYSVGLRLIYNF